jgi:membrane-bound lytic murein transglycosylase B
MLRAALLSLILCSAPALAETADELPAPTPDDVIMTVTQETLPAWIGAFRMRALAAGIKPEVFDAAMAGRQIRLDVLDRDRNQTEFTKTIWDYLDKAVSDDRIAYGKRALARTEGLMEGIEAQYGVDSAVVVAIWGLESDYGVVRGDIPTLDALMTLAADTRRGAYFERELLAALQILQAGDASPEAMTGSWAGAMGHTQFMPSTYLGFAVDHDGDGRRDLWGDDPTDALASTAAYLAHWGWQKGQPVAVEVTLPEGFNHMLADVRVEKSVAAWKERGIKAVTGELPEGPLAAVLLPAGARGPAFLIYPNFHVLERYNPADAYVIAVGHLADRITGKGRVQAAWPRDLRALSYAERVALQAGLTAAGFDAGGADGRIGPKTIAALRGWQVSRDLVPDGYPTPALVEAVKP